MQPHRHITSAISRRGILLLLMLLLPLLPLAQPAPAHTSESQPGLPPDLFGLNMYITGHERSAEEARALVQMARDIGVKWSREEISWATWGEQDRNDFYDERLGMLAEAGIGVVGMLLTTPEAYRDPACSEYALVHAEPAYWCPPTDVAAYADWAAMVVERYDADGEDDAPGSPRVAAWQIWNEPDQDGTWLPAADPAAYAAMLQAAYPAIKAADPTALVVSGGVMTFDTVGVNDFMRRVVEMGAWESFDVLAIHPWLIDHAPDDPTLINPRENFDVTIPGRMAMAQQWVAARGGGKPVWVSEVGWSTCGDQCEPQFAMSEAQQANYMVRTFVLAAAAGVQHVSYFQLEDKFQGGQVPWSQAAIVRDNREPKAAYYALGTLIQQLHAAQFSGTGPLHQPGSIADYRFTLSSGEPLDVLWSLGSEQTLPFPLNPGEGAVLIERDGATETLAERGGSVMLRISQRPLYLRQGSSIERSRTFAETGYRVSGRFLDYWERNGGLPIFGYPISEARHEIGSDGQAYLVQWFERNRFEYHPENAPPDDVLLGLLGIAALEQQGTDWQTFPTVETAPPGCRSFAETRHSLCPPFLGYWERNGGLPIFGYPISEPFEEQSSDDGATSTVQYFERNRFEYHPNNPPADRVLLGLLGVELLPR